MIKSGLVSITFRKHSPADIVGMVSKAQLAGIEWGADVHVLPGDRKTAREVGRMTRDAGLDVACYGSYYRLGTEARESFDPVLDCALELGAPMIRVWPGARRSVDADHAYVQQVADEALALAEQAWDVGMRIVYEYHANSLTDCAESAETLLKASAHPGIGSLWQTTNDAPEEVSLASLEALMPWVTNIHTFTWSFGDGKQDRRPLAEGKGLWTRVLERLRSVPGDRYCLLEFVRGDAPEQFFEDALTLNAWLAAPCELSE